MNITNIYCLAEYNTENICIFQNKAVILQHNFKYLVPYGKYYRQKKRNRTAAYYHEKLGFRRVDYLDANEKHICLYRDGVEFILTQSNGQQVKPNHELYGYGGDAYVIVKDQQALHDESIRCVSFPGQLR